MGEVEHFLVSYATMINSAQQIIEPNKEHSFDAHRGDFASAPQQYRIFRMLRQSLPFCSSAKSRLTHKFTAWFFTRNSSSIVRWSRMNFSSFSTVHVVAEVCSLIFCYFIFWQKPNLSLIYFRSANTHRDDQEGTRNEAIKRAERVSRARQITKVWLMWWLHRNG